MSHEKKHERGHLRGITNHRRGLRVASAAAVAGALLAGSGVATTAVASAAPKITLSFSYQQPTPGAPNWLQTVVKNYEKQSPSVSFQIADTLPSNDYLAKVSSQIGAGNAPDLFIGWTYNRLTPYAKGGRIANLKSLLSKTAGYKKVTPFALQAATVDGGVYAIPLTNDAEVIYYNKAVFAKNHITVPKTYDQFLSDIKALKAGGVAPIALGNTDSFNGSILYTMIAERLGGFKLYQKTVANQKGKFSNPSFIKAGTYLQNLVSMGAFNSNYSSETIGYAASLLTTGKAGMFINGTWETYALNQGLGKNLGWFTLPPIKGGADQTPQQMIELPNNAISISANASSSTKKAAANFVNYLLSEPAQKVEAKAGNALATTYNFGAGVTDPTTASIHEATTKATQAMAPWDTLLGVYLGEQFDNLTQQIYAGSRRLRVCRASTAWLPATAGLADPRAPALVPPPDRRDPSVQLTIPFLGTQYYRPPFPNSKLWRADLEKMAETGLDVVQLWVCWGWVEPRPGEFRFDDYDELCSLAADAGLGVVLSTIAEIQPFWIPREIPGATMIDSFGGRWCPRRGGSATSG